MLLVLGVVACAGDDEVTWTQYNAGDETVTVGVGAEEVAAPVSVPLNSNTGEVSVGTGTVDPGSGPIGTVHNVIVTVLEAYKDDVDRASVRIDSGDRGVDEYNLTADSTGEGIWVYSLESVGEAGETREDAFTFRLWSQDATEEE